MGFDHFIRDKRGNTRRDDTSEVDREALVEALDAFAVPRGDHHLPDADLPGAAPVLETRADDFMWIRNAAGNEFGAARSEQKIGLRELIVWSALSCTLLHFLIDGKLHSNVDKAKKGCREAFKQPADTLAMKQLGNGRECVLLRGDVAMVDFGHHACSHNPERVRHTVRHQSTSYRRETVPHGRAFMQRSALKDGVYLVVHWKVHRPKERNRDEGWLESLVQPTHALLAYDC